MALIKYINIITTITNMINDEINQAFDDEKNANYGLYEWCLGHYNMSMYDDRLKIKDIKTVQDYYSYISEPKILFSEILAGNNKLMVILPLLYIYNTKADPKWEKTKNDIASIFEQNSLATERYRINIDGTSLKHGVPLLVGKADYCDINATTSYLHAIILYNKASKLINVIDFGGLFGTKIMEGQKALAHSSAVYPKLLILDVERIPTNDFKFLFGKNNGVFIMLTLDTIRIM